MIEITCPNEQVGPWIVNTSEIDFMVWHDNNDLEIRFKSGNVLVLPLGSGERVRDAFNQVLEAQGPALLPVKYGTGAALSRIG